MGQIVRFQGRANTWNVHDENGCHKQSFISEGVEILPAVCNFDQRRCRLQPIYSFTNKLSRRTQPFPLEKD
jgi:hypothetical protein